jgi:hypothetical protein
VSGKLTTRALDSRPLPNDLAYCRIVVMYSIIRLAVAALDGAIPAALGYWIVGPPPYLLTTGRRKRTFTFAAIWFFGFLLLRFLSETYLLSRIADWLH